MLIGGTKYSFLEYEMDEEGIREIKYLFPYEVVSKWVAQNLGDG